MSSNDKSTTAKESSADTASSPPQRASFASALRAEWRKLRTDVPILIVAGVALALFVFSGAMQAESIYSSVHTSQVGTPVEMTTGPDDDLVADQTPASGETPSATETPNTGESETVTDAGQSTSAEVDAIEIEPRNEIAQDVASMPSAGLFLHGFTFFLMGALIMTRGKDKGATNPAVQAFPEQPRQHAAKAVTALGLSLAVYAMGVSLNTVMGFLALSGGDVDVALHASWYWRSLGTALLFIVGLTLFGIALGTLLRKTLPTIVVGFLVVWVIPVLVSIVDLNLYERVRLSTILPLNLTLGAVMPIDMRDDNPWPYAVGILLWGVIPAIAAYFVVQRRHVSPS